MNENEKATLFRPGVGRRGITELHWAAYRGDQNELQQQLELGADPNAKDQYRGYAALHWLADMSATGGPRVQMLRLLVAKGADVNLVADNGATALSLSEQAGSTVGEQLASLVLGLILEAAA
jgi:ankyrin repeat protein